MLIMGYSFPDHPRFLHYHHLLYATHWWVNFSAGAEYGEDQVLNRLAAQYSAPADSLMCSA